MSRRFVDFAQTSRWLDQLRLIGDEAADQDLNGMSAELSLAVLGVGQQAVGGVGPPPALGPQQLLRQLTTIPPGRPSAARGGWPEADCPTLRTYLNEPDLPPWSVYIGPTQAADPVALAAVAADPRRAEIDLAQWLRRGEIMQTAFDFFDAFGLQIGAALLFASLPTAYTAQRDVHVLDITGQLVSHPARRVRETTRFVISVMTPDVGREENGVNTLLPGGNAARDARRVRLIHAAVRQMMADDRDSQAARAAAEKAFQDRVDWGEVTLDNPNDQAARSFGEPISQYALLGTFLTFTVTVFQALDKLGVPYEPADKEAVFFLWSVVAAHLGLGDAAAAAGPGPLTDQAVLGPTGSLLPITPDEGERLMAIILEREQGPTIDGQVLTKALLEYVSRPLPAKAKPLPGAAIRYFLGDEVADMLAVPHGGWLQFAYDNLGWSRWLAGRAERGKTRGRFRKAAKIELSAQLSRAVLEGFMAVNDPRQADFEIPAHLVERWRLTPRTPSVDLVPYGQLQ